MLSLIGNISNAGLGMLSFALVARILGREEFGIFGVFLTLQTLYDMLRNGLIGQPLIKFFAEAENEQAEAQVVGSAWRFMALFSGISALLLSGIFGLIYWFFDLADFGLYAWFFAPLALVTIPAQMASWLLMARSRFDQLIWVRSSMQLVYILACSWAYWQNWGLPEILLIYLIANTVPSLLALIWNWDGWRHLGRASRAEIERIYRFGRYTLGTLLGGTLLNSSDVLLIRLFAGNEAVALYQVPQRLLGLADIPLRALASFAYPKLARSRVRGGEGRFREEFEGHLGLSFFALLPIALGAFIFAEDLVVLLGGAEYADAAIILQVFAVYLAFTALDRFSGLALDLLNRPHINLRKVLIMLAVNVLGDILVLWWTGSIVWVAVISIVTYAVGSLVGFAFLRDSLAFRPWQWLRIGAVESLRLVKKLVGN